MTIVGLAFLLVGVLVEGVLTPSRWRTVGGTLVLGSVFILALLPGNFENQKIVGRLLMPAGLVTLLLWALAWADLRRRRNWGRGLRSLGAFLVYCAAGSVPLGGWLLEGLEGEIPSDPGGRFDAVLVLGGGTSRDPTGRPSLGPSGDRLRRATQLFVAERTPILVASGHARPPFGHADLARDTATLWQDWGIPPEAIIELPEPTNTSEEIAAYRDLAQARGWKKVGLVSSAWHLPRALRLARRQGFFTDGDDLDGTELIEMVPLPAHHLTAGESNPSIFWWIPSGRGFRMTETWLWERLGQAVGR